MILKGGSPASAKESSDVIIRMSLAWRSPDCRNHPEAAFFPDNSPQPLQVLGFG